MPNARRKTATDPRPPAREPRPEDRPPIPDPLGDDKHVRPSGELTSGSPDHEGLLGSGSSAKPDGGVQQHPVHDEDAEDMGPDEFEQEFDEARMSAFEPRIDEETEEELDPLGEGIDPEAERER